MRVTRVLNRNLWLSIALVGWFVSAKEPAPTEVKQAQRPTQSRLPVLDLSGPGEGPREWGELPDKVTVLFQGEKYEGVTVAVHGQISRMFPKHSYNLTFPAELGFRARPGDGRVHKIDLLANFADKSKIRNTLAYEMIAACGCVGHFAFPVRVQWNGRFYSVAEVVEHGDGHWLKRVGKDPKGALYKMNNNLSGVFGSEKKTRKEEDMSDLAALSRVLTESRPIEARAAYAYGNIDIPQCISYFVAMALISSDDHGHKNYYLYRDTRGTGEWSIFPWDVDLSWGRNWTGQYFNETIFVDNPLDLYREGRHKARNRLYNLFFEYPDFRQMYLRRLRTVMDKLLLPPGTPSGSLLIERRVHELMDLVDPPGVKPSDAALDQAAWPSWGRTASMRQEAQRIIDEYLPGRRRFLFANSHAVLLGDRIPEGQPISAALDFGPLQAEGPAAERHVTLTNRNSYAVDLSDWRLAGAGIDHTFRPGTVVPGGKSLSVVAEVVQFRKGATKTGQPPGLVQGNWKGELSPGKGPLQLMTPAGRIVAAHEVSH